MDRRYFLSFLGCLPFIKLGNQKEHEYKHPILGKFIGYTPFTCSYFGFELKRDEENLKSENQSLWGHGDQVILKFENGSMGYECEGHVYTNDEKECVETILKHIKTLDKITITMNKWEDRVKIKDKVFHLFFFSIRTPDYNE